MAAVALTSALVMPSAATETVLPLIEMPVPAVSWPAPENCENDRLVVFSVMGSAVDSTHAEAALAVPADTQQYMPLVTSASVSASVARVRTYGLLASPTEVTV